LWLKSTTRNREREREREGGGEESWGKRRGSKVAFIHECYRALQAKRRQNGYV